MSSATFFNYGQSKILSSGNGSHLVFGRVENIMEKGENPSYQHLLPFQQCFKKISFIGLLKIRTVL